ncbi:MAG: hypothetical protein IJP54_07190 [Synergistaceae bacterium]|nr:hypothetical protein [Synergistaceae bacterium]MBR0035445.1 hypothetical protein [Synergistaceae bacterium]
MALKDFPDYVKRELDQRFSYHEYHDYHDYDNYGNYSDSAMNDDVQSQIRGRIEQDESRETSQLARELSAIDGLLSKISSLERVN